MKGSTGTVSIIVSKGAPPFSFFLFLSMSPREPLILLLSQHHGEEPIRVFILWATPCVERIENDIVPAGYICLGQSGIRTMARIKGVYVWGMNVGISRTKNREIEKKSKREREMMCTVDCRR